MFLYSLFFVEMRSPQIVRLITVEGINVEGNKAELFLEDSTCMTVNSELLQAALSTETNPTYILNSVMKWQQQLAP